MAAAAALHCSMSCVYFDNTHWSETSREMQSRTKLVSCVVVMDFPTKEEFKQKLKDIFFREIFMGFLTTVLLVENPALTHTVWLVVHFYDQGSSLLRASSSLFISSLLSLSNLPRK